MKVHLKHGIDKVVFGMKQNDVVSLYGKPDKEYKDEDDNVIFLYNEHQLRLTFYAEEGFKLGYIIASADDLEVLDINIIRKNYNEVKDALASKGIAKFTKEEFDSYENYFNEENWIILQTEFGEIVKFELGAIINDKDEFDWKFKK